jgi:hypothetical protein
MNTPFVAVVFPGVASAAEAGAIAQRILDNAQRTLPEPAKAVRGDKGRMCFLMAGPAHLVREVLAEACPSQAEWLLVQAGPASETRGLTHDGTWLVRHTARS